MYHSPGMQKLLDTCRDQGARNVVVAEGLNWGYDLAGVVKGYALNDPRANNVAYSTHIYPAKGGPKDWELHVTPAVKKYAVLIGEFAPGGDSSLEKIVEYADQHQLPWLAWCLHPSIKPCLIKNWDYVPTPYEEAVKKVLRQRIAKP